MWDLKKHFLEVSDEEIKRFVSQLRDFSGDSILFNLVGGEPLLREGIMDIVKFIMQCGFSASITTNGYLLDEEIARQIADSGLTSIFISLDTLDGKKHDFLRGTEGSWKKAMEAIEALGKVYPKAHLGINTIILEQSLDGILPLIEWVNRNDMVDAINLMAVMQPYESQFDRLWYKKGEFSYLWPQDPLKLQDLLDEIIDLKTKGYKIINPISQIRMFKDYFKNPLGFVKKTKCNLGYSSVFINIEGEVHLCFNHGSLGNIKKDSFSEMWDSPKADLVREKINSCHENCELLINCAYEED